MVVRGFGGLVAGIGLVWFGHGFLDWFDLGGCKHRSTVV